MLHHRLRGAGNKSAVYVGGNFAFYTASTNLTISLTSLTGGIDTSARTGDLVLVAYGATSEASYNLPMSMVTTGYTEIADLYSADDFESNLGIYTKVMGATPDTVAQVYGAWEEGPFPIAIAVQVWRNASSTTPITTATGASTGKANPPSITPTIAKSKVVVVGAGTNYNEVAFTAPSGIDSFQTQNQDPNLGMGIYNNWVSGAYDCAAFGGGSTNSWDSWCAASIVIQPK